MARSRRQTSGRLTEPPADLPAARARWLAAARATERADRAVAETALAACYRAGGYEPVTTIHWYKSPAAALRATSRFKALEPLAELPFCYRLRRDVFTAAWRRVGGRAWREVLAEVGTPWREALGAVHRPLIDRHRMPANPVPLDELPRPTGDWTLADFDAARPLVPEIARLDDLIILARSCFLAFTFRRVAVLIERPARLRLDQAGRLHAVDRPAVRWRDGEVDHAWRGMIVPARLVRERHDITLRSIRSTPNAEMRRVLTEIYAELHGPDALLGGQLPHALVSSDVVHGLERQLRVIDGQRYVVVANGSLEPDGTRRRYMLGTDPAARTPHDAVAASYGIASSHYVEAVRT